MTRNLIIAAVVLIIATGGIILIAGSQGQKQPEQETPSPTQQMTEEVVKSDDPVIFGKKADSSMATEENSVTIENFAFSPSTITVKKGAKVIWTNQDTVKHNASGDDGSFDTGLIAKGETMSITFDKAGTYQYHCTPHPNMKATVTVIE